MKKILLISLVTMIVGCQKQPEKVDDSAADKQFEESDKKIGEFLDTLRTLMPVKVNKRKYSVMIIRKYTSISTYQHC
jgi:hypothetical protein